MFEGPLYLIVEKRSRRLEHRPTLPAPLFVILGNMERKGFGLIEILVVVVLFAVLAGGGWYLSSLKNSGVAISAGTSAEQQARQVVQQTDRQTGQEQNAVDQATGPQSQSSSRVQEEFPAQPREK